MRISVGGSVWACWALVVSLFAACSASNGQGSETHFISCKNDAECVATGQVCVASRCASRQMNAGGADASAAGTDSATGNGARGGAPGSGGTSVVSLTHDSGVAGMGGEPEAPDSSSAEFAYFYDNPVDFGTVFAVPKGAGSSVALEKGKAPVNIARSFTFDAASLYYTWEDTSSKVLALPRSGRGAPRTIVSGLHVVNAVAVDATSLYFIDVDNGATAVTLIGKVPLQSDSPDGGAFETILPPENAAIGGLTTYGDYVYWVKNTGGAPTLTGVIQRAPKTGGPAETIATEVINAQQVFVDGSGVYWLNEGHIGVDCTATDGDVRYLASGSTTPVVLISKLAGANSFVIANGSLVVATAGAFCNVAQMATGSISKVAIPSGAITALLPNVSGPSHLFFDGSDLYYTVVSDPENYILTPAMMKP